MASQPPTTQPSGSKKGRKDKKDKRKNSQKDLTELILEDVPLMNWQTGIDVRSKGIARGIDGPYPSMSGGSSNAGNTASGGHQSHSKQNSSQASSPAVNGRPSLEMSRSSLDTPRSGRPKLDHATGKSSQRVGVSAGQGRVHAYPQASKSSHELRSQYVRTNSEKATTPGADGKGYPHPRSPHPPNTQLHMPSANSTDAIMQWQMQVPESNMQRSYFDAAFRHPSQEFFQYALHPSRPNHSHPNKNGQQPSHHNGQREYNGLSNSPADALQSPNNIPGLPHDQPRKPHSQFPSAEPNRHIYNSFPQSQQAYHSIPPDNRDKKAIPRSNRTYFVPSPGENYGLPPDTDTHHYQSAQGAPLPYPVSEEDFGSYPSIDVSSNQPVSFFNDVGPGESFGPNHVSHSATIDNLRSASGPQDTRISNVTTHSPKPQSVMGPPQLRRASDDGDLRGQKSVNPSTVVRSPSIDSREPNSRNSQNLPQRPLSSVSHYSYHRRIFSGASVSDQDTDPKTHFDGGELVKGLRDDQSARRPSLPDNLSTYRQLPDNRQQNGNAADDDNQGLPPSSNLPSPSHYESFDYTATRRPPIKIEVPSDNESAAMVSHQPEALSAVTPHSASIAHYSDGRRSPFISPMRNHALSISQLSSSSNANTSQPSPGSSRPKLEELVQSDGEGTYHQPYGPFVSNLGVPQKDTPHSATEDHRAGITRQRRVHGRNSSGGDGSQKGRRPSPYVSPTSSSSQRSPLSEGISDKPSTWVLPPDFLSRPSNRHPSHSEERQQSRSLGPGSHQSLHLSKRKVVVMATRDFDNFSVVALPEIISPRNVKAVLCEKVGLSVIPEFVEISLVEIGQLESGEALSDIALQEICLNSDSKGSTKFYVSVCHQNTQEPRNYSDADKSNFTLYDRDTAYSSSLRNSESSRLPSPRAENLTDDSLSPRTHNAEKEPKSLPNNSSASSPRVAPSSENAHSEFSPPAPENNKSDIREMRRTRPIVPAKPAAFSATNRHGLLLDTTPNGPDGLRSESFRVIRQPPRREINFDKPRCSPYDETNKTLAAHIDRAAQQELNNERSLNDSHDDSSSKSEKVQKPDLVAKRAAPPAPSRSSSIYSVKSGKVASPVTTANSKDTVPETSAKDKPSHNQPSYGLPPSLVRRTSNRRRKKTPVARKPVPAPSYPLDTSSSSKATPAVQRESADDDKAKGSVDEPKGDTTTEKPGEKHTDMSPFKENEISFEGAPDLTFSQDEDDDSSDDGLWAKKPPGQSSETSSEPVQNSNSKGSQPSKSPVSPVEPRADEKPSTPSVSDGWAVRPSEEDVYENLEKFFPNTDLDKPIPDDVPVNDADGRLLSLPSPVNERSTQSSKSSGPPSGVRKEHDIQSKKETNKADLSQVPAAPPVPADSRAPPENRGGGSKLSRATRNRSIRIVANEARRKFSKVNEPPRTQSSESGGNRDLLRRTSTKLWGQKAVEVTKTGGLRKSHIGSKRVRSSAKAKQFAWVKGELIGKGTFGKVYLALNITTGEMMAVKQVELPKTASDKASERQREVIEAHYAEIETMKDLDHPNIVQYLGYEANEDFHSLFLEYVPGGSVGTCLRKHGHFEESVIRFLTKQVLEGLAYLHSSGILHRDLKADNLLIDRGGLCKISDFGISKRSHDIYANDAGMSMQGTIFWMAPEVINNVIKNEKQGYSAKVDIWSLGCVVLEMYAGRRPWSNDEAIGAMYKLGNYRLAPPIPEDTKPNISSCGQEFLDLCFTVEPSKRPTASELLKHEFAQVPKDFRFVDTNLAKAISLSTPSDSDAKS